MIAKTAASADLAEGRPTFLQVKRPQAIDAFIQQMTVDDSDELQIIKIDAWNGPRSRADVSANKDAKSDNVEAMRKIAFDFAIPPPYHSLLIDREKSDLAAAEYWFQRAVECGSTEARFEVAYIRDLQRQLDQRADGMIYVELDVQKILSMIENRSKALQKIAHVRSAMDGQFLRQGLRNMDKDLLRLVSSRHWPSLEKEVRCYLNANLIRQGT